MKKLTLIIAIVFSGMLMQAQSAIIKNKVGAEIRADKVISINGDYITYVRDNTTYSINASSITYTEDNTTRYFYNYHSPHKGKYYTTGRKLTTAGVIVLGVGLASGIGAIIQAKQNNRAFLIVPAATCITVSP